MRPPAIRLAVAGRHRWIVLALALLFALAACDRGTPFQPAAVDEIKPGPGLFTGKAGAFVIYRAPRRADD